MNRTEARARVRDCLGAFAALTVLAACGGGGGGYGGGGGEPVTYTLGGMASGVNGPGLELRNGDERLAVPAAGGPFTFVTRLVQGASYAVTVSGHPANQTCSVTNPSGTMGSANITNVAVACIASAPPAGLHLHAGSYGGPGAVEGAAAQARFSLPWAVAVDAQGNRYVADTANHVIRRIAPGGQVSTLAGRLGASGSSDGAGDAARFVFPKGLALDGNGSLYVADAGNHTIRRIRLSDGDVTTVAGVPGLAGAAVGGGSANEPATVREPTALLHDGTRLLVADSGNHAVRALVAPHVLVPFAGTPGPTNDGDAAPQAGPSLARLRWPTALARLPSTGEVLVLDQGNCVVRGITATEVRIVAGANRDCRSVDGERSLARLHTAVSGGLRPGGLVVAPGDRVFVDDDAGLREVRLDGSIRRIALRSGAAQWSYRRMTGLAVEPGGDTLRLLAAEPSGHAVVSITVAQDAAEASVLAGQRRGSGIPSVAGDFGDARGVGLAGSQDLLVHGQRGVHQLSADGPLQHLLPLTGDVLGVLAAGRNGGGLLYAVVANDFPTGPEVMLNGYSDGQLRFTIPGMGKDGSPGPSQVDYPLALDIDSAGRAVVADAVASVMWLVDGAGGTTRLAGQRGVYETRLGDALNEATFSGLGDLVVAANDDIYVLDGMNVVKVALVNGRHVVSVAAQDVDGAQAIAVDAHHNLYVAVGAPRCEVLRIRASDGQRSVLAGSAGRCTFSPGALPGALALGSNGWTRMRVRDGYLWISMEGGVVRIGPLEP